MAVSPEETHEFRHLVSARKRLEEWQEEWQSTNKGKQKLNELSKHKIEEPFNDVVGMIGGKPRNNQNKAKRWSIGMY